MYFAILSVGVILSVLGGIQLARRIIRRIHHLSTATEQVAAGELRLRVLPVGTGWFGMTFLDDAPLVRDRIAELVASGEYPGHLREGLS